MTGPGVVPDKRSGTVNYPEQLGYSSGCGDSGFTGRLEESNRSKIQNGRERHNWLFGVLDPKFPSTGDTDENFVFRIDNCR